MADYGKTAATYKPVPGIYTGLIGKIAEEIIRGEMVNGRFNSLIKGTFKSGKDLEIALLKRAKGVAYNRTTPPTVGAPETSVLYHTQDVSRTYGVLLDDNEIQEGTISEENAKKYAGEVIQTLYNGAEDEQNNYIVSILKDANAGNKEIIVDTYKYNDFKTERGCKELLQEINTVSAYIRKGEKSVNPQGNKVAADMVGVLIPERIVKGLDVWARMGAYNEKYGAIDADYVFTYTPDEGDEGEIFVFDVEYMQVWKKRPDSYKEHPVAGCDNVEAFLHRYMLYAGCPLFSCVKITQDSAPQDYTQSTVKALMYGADPTSGGAAVPVAAMYGSNSGGYELLTQDINETVALNGLKTDVKSIKNSTDSLGALEPIAQNVQTLKAATDSGAATVVYTGTRG